MKAATARRALLALSMFSAAATGRAQALPPTAPSNATSKEDLIVLSPFEVNSESDHGYQPTAILQGGRGRIDLADVAGQVAVFTKDFMEDLGVTTMDEAFLFSATTQTYYDNVNGNGDNRPGSRNTADDASNSRGLGVVDRTRNFFRTTMDPDSYNTERLTLVSGANAVQFGLGGAAGTAESTTVRASLNRSRQSTQYRTDSYGSQRYVLDVSQVILKNKLALRAIGLREDKEYFLRPGWENNRRGFVTMTYQPFKRTTIRIEGEYHYRLDSRPPTVVTRDRGYMSFLANPIVYDNRANTASTTGRPPVPSYTMTDGTRVNYAFSTKPALYIWPQNAAPQFTGLQDVRNTVFVSLGDTGAGAAQSQSLSVPGFPWNVNEYGGSRLNRRRTRNLTGTIEQQLGRATFLELGYAWEFYRNHTAQLFASNGVDVMVDVNRFMPDGVTANPMYGRPFVESNNAAGQGQWADDTFKQYRATLTHEVDLTHDAGWTRHLGRHRLGFFASHDDTAEYFLGNNRFLIIGNPSFLSAAAQANPLHADRAFYMRYYLPTIGSTDDPFAYAIPPANNYGDIMGIMNFTTRSGEPFQVTEYMNPLGFVGTTPRASHLQRLSGAASTSSTFWDNRLVVNLGVRHDRVRNSDFAAFTSRLTQNPPTAANPLGSGLMAYDDFRQRVPADVWTPYRKATRVNYGFVVRPPGVGRWLSIGYDFSRNASLNEVAVVRDVNGSEVEPAYGESHEYNVRLRLLDDRLNIKLNYFNALQRNTTLADGGLRSNLIDFEQQLYANDPRYAINPLFKPELNPLASQFRLPGDRNSKGLELDLTFNPSRHWRIFANAGRTDTKLDDISTQPWWDYLDAKLAPWRAYGGNWSTARYDNNLTVEGAYNSLIAGPIDNIKENLGNPGGNSQTWRSSLVATRMFSEGWLKGAATSVNFRYRGPRLIGFPTRVDAKGVARIDRASPYKSDDYILTGLMANYRCKGPGRTSWRVQLNANNIFNTERYFVTRVFDNGAPRNYGRQAGREFILSVDIEH